MHLSQEDRHRIQEAATAAEVRSGIHFATAIVPASDRYALYALVWGAIVAFLAGAVLALAWPAVGWREGFAILTAAFVAASLVFDWWPVRLLVVPRHTRHAHASSLAHREFAARILAGRADRRGVLVFISLGERYAEVIADKELHARLGGEHWNGMVVALVSAARSGRVADGVIHAIESCARAVSGK